MLRLIARLLAGALTLGGAIVVATAVPAFACPPGTHQEGTTTEVQPGPYGPVTVVIANCVANGSNGTNTPGTNGTPTCPGAPGGNCAGPNGGTWFGAPWLCYAVIVDPPAGSPQWLGHDPSEGHVWSCGAPQPASVCNISPVVCPGFLPGNQTPGVDPRTLALEALGRMQLETAEIHMAPAPPNKTYVGLETWLWVPEAQWREMSLTVRAGGTSVTVTAEPIRSEWDMSTGRINCTSPGRKWIRGMGDNEQTDCSYAWQKVSSFEPNGTFKVSAAIVYGVSWTCAGICPTSGGTLDDTAGPTSNSAIRVGERQSVVIEGAQG